MKKTEQCCVLQNNTKYEKLNWFNRPVSSKKGLFNMGTKINLYATKSISQ